MNNKVMNRTRTTTSLLQKQNKYDRIIPYVGFNDKCLQKYKDVKTATKSQKEIYDFNKNILLRNVH